MVHHSTMLCNIVHVYGRKGFLYKAILVGTNMNTSHYIPPCNELRKYRHVDFVSLSIKKNTKSMWTQQLASAHFWNVFSWTNSVHLQHFCCKVCSI